MSIRCRKCGADFKSKDPYEDLCNPCLKTLPRWEPECATCRCKLVQDPFNLYHIYCPVCERSLDLVLVTPPN